MRRWLICVAICGITACGSEDTTGDSSQLKAPPTTFDGALVSDASAKVAHGKRLTDVLGCKGCHGKTLEGNVWVDGPEEGLLHASNLTRAIPSYTDAQFKRLLSTGEHPRRKELWEMPSELFQHLAASDVEALIAYLRTLKPAGEPSPEPVIGPLARQLIAKGELKPAAQLVRETRNDGPVDLGPTHELGRYITRVTCAECHGSKLEGEGKTPDLITVGAYEAKEFEQLITQGVPKGNRKLHPMMVGVAKGRFSKLTPHERSALYAYLKARATQP